MGPWAQPSPECIEGPALLPKYSAGSMPQPVLGALKCYLTHDLRPHGGGGAERATALGWWLRPFAWPHLRHPLLLELNQEAEASVLKSGASPGHRDQPALVTLCCPASAPEWGPLQEAEGRGSHPSRLDIRGEWGGGATNSLSQALSPFCTSQFLSVQWLHPQLLSINTVGLGVGTATP